MKENILWVEQAWTDTFEKVKSTSKTMSARFPSMTTSGIYSDTDRPWGWVVGFWPGLLWLLYEKENYIPFKDIAISRELTMDGPLDEFINIHHDVGFMWQLTSIKHYELLGNEQSKTRALRAASHLASRFNINGRFLTAWNKNDVNTADPRGLSIIDSMMNLPILYWAAEQLDAPRFKLIAMAHADTVLKEFIREDGSVRHMVEFDYLSGEIKQYHGGQGYNQNSAWSRGASWAVHGFALSYQYTKEVRYLEAAMKTADFFITGLAEDSVPYWDFRAPIESDTPRDTSAGACAASGLLLLSDLAPTPELREKYLSSANDILKSLYENYGTYKDSNNEGILVGGTFNHPKGLGIDCSLIYGDYYFVEGLYRLKNKLSIL
ncbi:glycoside hydrolase family 88 protein [Vibrio sp. FNV 38]|nr:glycoside hydrolase family 88 protein [Vibrio sp. FNV 38]